MSYTSIDQSKTLSYLISDEYSDLHYELTHFDVPKTSNWFLKFGHHKITPEFIPCWSLDSLFKAVPIPKGYSAKNLCYRDNTYYCIISIDGSRTDGIITQSDTAVDAVYLMILDLKSRGLL